MQRQYNVGLNSNHPSTISLAVDNKRRYPRPPPRAPENAWSGGNADVRNRRYYDETGKLIMHHAHSPSLHAPMLGKTRQQLNAIPPRYPPAYTSNVSHLVV